MHRPDRRNLSRVRKAGSAGRAGRRGGRAVALLMAWMLIAPLMPLPRVLPTPAVAVAAASFANGAFERLWRRTDGPVRSGATARSWVWGPEPRFAAEAEAYRDAPGGTRLVQYFDKSRMELTDPARDPADPYYVTNGLLATELVTGRLQLGDAAFESHLPSAIPVAGDADDTTGPTYATFGPLRASAATAPGSALTTTLARDGTTANGAPRLAGRATARTYVPETGHTVADVFWAFMTASGPVDGGGIEPLFRSPFYATGYPISEAYWAEVRVAGESRQVLVQVFERRVLTFTPGNPVGFGVEAGNVGLHYRLWRAGLSGGQGGQGGSGASTIAVPASVSPSPPPPASPAPPTPSAASPPPASTAEHATLAALIVEVTPGGVGGDAMDEHITIINGGDAPLSLTGWTLRDTRGHVYTFGSYTLPTDGTVTVRSTKGADTATDRYWNQATALLTNTEPETITLHDAANTLVDRYPYP